jgi:membrane protein YqaA with SNARE-associated domain
MLKQLYQYVLQLAGHKYAPWALFAVAFIESSFFPIPPDVLLIPMIMARFERAFLYAAICTVGSVVGGMFGYALGAIFADTLGQSIVDFYGAGGQLETLSHWYNEQLWVVIGAAGFSPIPYKIFTILSGMMAANFPTFVVASLISRG